jgi:hypothetical protein
MPSELLAAVATAALLLQQMTGQKRTEAAAGSQIGDRAFVMLGGAEICIHMCVR